MSIKLPKIDLKTILIVVLAGVLIFSTRACNQRDGQITQLQLEKQTTDSIKNLYGQTILIQQTIETNNKQAIKDLTDSLFNLTKSQDRKIKDAIAYYKGITNTVIREVPVPYVDVPKQKQWEDSVSRACAKVIDYYEANTVTVPKPAKDSTKDYSIDLIVRKDGVFVNRIAIPDSQYIRFVTLKGRLLKRNQEGKLKLWLKPEVQVQVIHTNKLIQVTGQNSAIYTPPNKPRLLEKAILVGGGILLGTKLQP